MFLSRAKGFRVFVLVSGTWGAAAHSQDLTITPRLDVVYDSNVARASDEVAEARGLDQRDTRFSPGVLLEAGFGGRQTLFARADVGYDFYQRNGRLNSERFLGEAGGQLQFGRCQASPLVSLSRRQSDLVDFVDLERVDNKQTATTVRVDGRCGGPVGLIPIFGVSQSWARNSDELRRYGNSNSTTFHGGLAYGRPTFGELSLSTRYTRVRYPDEGSPFGFDPGDGYNTVSIGARYERRIGSRLGGSVGAYRTTVNPLDAGGKFSGLTADANIDLTVGAATRLSLAAARDVRPANLFGGDYVIASTIAGSVRHALGPRLELNGRASFDDREVRGEIPLLLPLLRNEKRYLAAAGASYRFAQRTSVAVEIARETRDAEPDIFEFSSTRAMLSLRQTIGRRK